MKRTLLGVTTGLVAAFFGSVQTGLAWYEFCDWDPPIVVVTPAGQLATVHDSVWTSSLLNIGLPVETHSVSRVYSSTGQPETKVDMTLYVPTELLWRFPYTAYVATGPLLSGQVLAEASGTSGSPTHLSFILKEA